MTVTIRYTMDAEGAEATTIRYVQSVRLMSSTMTSGTFEVKCFGNEPVTHRGVKWIETVWDVKVEGPGVPVPGTTFKQVTT